MAAKQIPDGYHSITPYLIVSGVSKLIDFLKQAFDAREVHRSALPNGTIMHADVRIGDSHIMMGEACGPMKPMPAGLYHYVTDVDGVYARAMQAGGVSINEPRDEFYGDRMAGIKDPSGNTWWIATHKEDVSPEELKRRQEIAIKQRSQKT